MKRFDWLSGVKRKTFDDIYNGQRIRFAPKKRDVVEDFDERGVRMIRKVGGITPDNLVPTGTILWLTGQDLPSGFEWVQ
jgi:hypothetical protein